MLHHKTTTHSTNSAKTVVQKLIKIDVKAVVCPKCGVPVNGNNAESNSEDRNSFWWNVLGGSFPIVGLILWAVWYKEYPKRAHGICAWSWVGFVISFLSTLFISVIIILSEL